VRDSATLLDATCGAAPGEPYSAPPRARPFSEEVKAAAGELKIAFSAAPPTGTPVHPDCIAAVNDAAMLCAELGHDVVEASPTFDGGELIGAFMVMWSAASAWMIDEIGRRTKQTPAEEKFEPLTWEFYRIGRGQSAADYLSAVEQCHTVACEMARFFMNHDLWLTPTLAEPPVPLGTFDPPPEER